jgi:hypothetical protein
MKLSWKHLADYWRLGAVFGVIFFVFFTALSMPWLLARG